MDALAAEREVILKQLIGQVGKNVFLEPPLFVDYGANISLGDGFYANAKYAVSFLSSAVVPSIVGTSPTFCDRLSSSADCISSPEE